MGWGDPSALPPRFTLTLTLSHRGRGEDQREVCQFEGRYAPFVLRTFPPPSGGNPAALRPRFTLTLALSHRGRGVNRWRLVGVGVYYAVESGGAFVDPFGGVGEEEFYAEV